MSARIPFTATVDPSAATLTTLLTVSDGYKARARIIAHNFSGSGGAYRVAVVPAGDTINQSHYLAFGETLGTHEREDFGEFFLNPGDSVVVYDADGGKLNFIANGYTTAVS